MIVFVVHPGSGTVVPLRECQITFSPDAEEGDEALGVINQSIHMLIGAEVETFLIDTVLPAVSPSENTGYYPSPHDDCPIDVPHMHEVNDDGN